MTVRQKRVAAGVLALSLGIVAVFAQKPTDGVAAPQPPTVCPHSDQTTAKSKCPCEPFATKPTDGSDTKAKTSSVSEKPKPGDHATAVPPPPMPGLPEMPIPIGTPTDGPPPVMPAPILPAPATTPDMPPAVVTEPNYESVPVVAPEPFVEPPAPPEAPTPEPEPETSEPTPEPAPKFIEAMTPVEKPTEKPEPAPEPEVEYVPTPTPEVKPARATEPEPTILAVPLRMLVRLGDGTPRFEVKTGDALLLKVYAERFEMDSKEPMPENGLPKMTAVGDVRFYGPGISGSCESLSVLSSTGEIALNGKVTMKSKEGKLYHEITAAKVHFQLGGTGYKVTDSGVIQTATYSEPKE